MLLQMVLFHPFLRLNSSPLYMYSTSLSIHLSMDTYTASFHILVIVNGAVMNTGVRVSFPISFLQIMPPKCVLTNLSKAI